MLSAGARIGARLFEEYEVRIRIYVVWLEPWLLGYYMLSSLACEMKAEDLRILW